MPERRILLVAPAWVGDAVMSQPLLAALMPAHIDVVAPAWTLTVYQRMAEVQQGLISPFKHGELSLWKRWQLAQSLRARSYDQAIVLPNSLKSALLPFFARIPQRTGYVGEFRQCLLNDCHVLDERLLPKMAERFYALAKLPQTTTPIPYPKLQTDTLQQARLCETWGIDRTTSWLVLCPGAEYGEAKRWPAEHFGQLAHKLIEQGHGVLIVGSNKDLPAATVIEQYLHHVPKHLWHNLCGKTRLDEAIDIMDLAHTVVCNDSGLMHIAAALNKRVLAIYGSSSPEFTPPLCAQQAIISLNLKCSPCFERRCPLGHLKCLRDLSVAQVLTHIQSDGSGVYPR